MSSRKIEMLAPARDLNSGIAAINTLFRDDELERGVRLSHDLAATGVDALIIQDVGLLEFELPPIALHSSTQMNNRLVEFFQRHGVSVPGSLRRRLQVTAVDAPAVMTTKYCIKNQLSICPKVEKKKRVAEEKLTLADNCGEYELSFDCARCEMIVRCKSKRE